MIGRPVSVEKQRLTRLIDRLDGLEVEAEAIHEELDTKATAASVVALDARVTTAEGEINAQASLISSVQAEVGTKASASAVTTLEARVTSTETTNTSQATAITNLTSEVAGKASASALNSLTTRVTTAEGEIDSLASDITSLTATVDGKASASALNTLEARVTATETTNTSQASSITSLNSSISTINSDITALEGDVATKASATALSSLTTEVTSINGEVTSLASALTDLFAGDVAGNEASVRVQMEAVTAPAGYHARYAIQVRANSSLAFSSAGIYLDANNSGASRVTIDASDFTITNGSSDVVPFSVSGGVAYAQNMNLSNATIGSLTIGTANIASNAISVSASSENPSASVIAASYSDAVNVFLSWGSSLPESLDVDYSFKSVVDKNFTVIIKFGSTIIGGPFGMRGPNDALVTGFDLIPGSYVSGTGGWFTIAVQRDETGVATELRNCRIRVGAKLR